MEVGKPAGMSVGAGPARHAAIARERGRRGRETHEHEDESRQGGPPLRALAATAVHPSPFDAPPSADVDLVFKPCEVWFSPMAVSSPDGVRARKFPRSSGRAGRRKRL